MGSVPKINLNMKSGLNAPIHRIAHQVVVESLF